MNKVCIARFVLFAFCISNMSTYATEITQLKEEQKDIYVSGFCERVHKRIYFEKRLKRALEVLQTIQNNNLAQYPCDLVAYLEKKHFSSPLCIQLIDQITEQQSIAPALSFWQHKIQGYKYLNHAHVHREFALIVIALLRNCLFCIAPKQKLPLILQLFDQVVHLPTSQLLDSIDDFVHCFLSYKMFDAIKQVPDPFDYFITTRQEDTSPPAKRKIYTELMVNRYYYCKQLDKAFRIIEQLADEGKLSFPHLTHKNKPLFSCPIIQKYARLSHTFQSAKPLRKLWQDFQAYRCLESETHNIDLTKLIFLILRECGHKLIHESPVMVIADDTAASLLKIEPCKLLGIINKIAHTIHVKVHHASWPLYASSFFSFLRTTHHEIHEIDQPSYLEPNFDFEPIDYVLIGNYSPAGSINQATFNLYVHYYFVIRMQPFISLLKKQNPSIALIDAAYFKHPGIKQMILNCKKAKTLKPFFDVWRDITLFNYLDDKQFIHDITQICFMLLQQKSDLGIQFLNDSKHFAGEKNQLTDLLTCPLLERATIREYVVRRFRPLFKFICKKPIQLPHSAAIRQFPWTNIAIKRCVENMITQKNSKAFDIVCHQFKQFYGINDDQFSSEFLRLTCLVLYQCKHTNLRESDINELYEILCNLPLEKMLDTIEILYTDLADWTEDFEFHSEISWHDWFKKYWWSASLALSIILLKIGLRWRNDDR